MEFNELMQSFAAKVGITSLAIKNEMAVLEIDGSEFGFIHDPANDALIVVVDLGQQSVDADGPFGSMMLRANYLFETTKGSTIFQNPKNGLFGIQQLFRLLELDADRLFAEVEAMANLAEDWMQILEGCSQVEAELKARNAESPATEPSGLGSSGIMRI